MKRDAKANCLEQCAKAFSAITTVWLKRCGEGEAVKSDKQSKETLADCLLESDFNQNETILIAKMQQEVADFSIEELNLIRIQLGKAFLQELDNKLGWERANQDQFKARTIFD